MPTLRWGQRHKWAWIATCILFVVAVITVALRYSLTEPDARLLRTLQADAAVFAVAINQTNTWIAAGDLQGTLYLWPLEADAQPVRIPAHQGRITALAFAPNGTTLVSGGDDGHLYAWDVPSGARKQSFDGLTELGGVILFDSHGQSYIYGGGIYDVQISPDGRYLAGVGWQGHILLYELPNGRRIAARQVYENAGQLGSFHTVERSFFSPDSRFLMTSSGSRSLQVWTIPTLDAQASYTGSMGSETKALFWKYPAGNVTMASLNSIVEVWSNANNTQPTTFAPGVWDIPSAALHPNGVLLARAGPSGEGSTTAGIPWIGQKPDPNIYLSASPYTESIMTLRGHTEVIHSLAFSTDETYLVSGGNDRTVRLWSVQK